MLPKDLVPLAQKVSKEEAEARIVNIVAARRTAPLLDARHRQYIDTGTSVTSAQAQTPYFITTTNPYTTTSAGTWSNSNSTNTLTNNTLSSALGRLAT